MKQEQKKALGSRLQSARKAAEFSQAFVALHLGITRQAVSSWEAGGAVPSALQLGELSALYCVCAHELLFGEQFAIRALDVIAAAQSA